MDDKLKLTFILNEFEDNRYAARKGLLAAREAGDGRAVAKFKDRVVELDRMIDSLEAEYAKL